LSRNRSEAQPLGSRILTAIRNVLQRCEEVGEKVGYPGEGGERRFRAWLNSDLLQQTLNWPPENVVVGEIFDLLLLSDDQHALATIETKTPYHKASRKEQKDFEERLSGYPALRTAYFTNGPEWHRLDIVVTGGHLSILDRSSLDTRKASAEVAEAFFGPVIYEPETEAPLDRVYSVNRDNPFIGSTLTRLASDLDRIVADLSEFYSRLFYGLREGRAGASAQQVVMAVYEQWCGKSLRVTPRTAATALASAFKQEGVNPLNINRTLAHLGLEGPDSSAVIESIMSLVPERRQDSELLIEALWPAFAASIMQLSAQTAHVSLARALLYRVGEDEKVFPRQLSGEHLRDQLSGATTDIMGRRFPATELLEDVRSRMQAFLPTVYLRGEFDWWAVLPEKRAVLTPEQLAWLRDYDDEMEKLSRILLRRLSHYRFESVDVDIWRNIYENYLPDEERQRLGGFYTPDELIDLILDLAGYRKEIEGLCRLSYVDPACGSGAFVTTALGRLLAHLDLNLPCHSPAVKRREPEWKTAEERLQLVAERVHAVDLHPFASFLSTLNVLFMLLPLYVKARDKDPDFTIDLHVFVADSLERPEKMTGQQTHMFEVMNSRVQLSADSHERYRRIMNTKFDFVFGNPPWGGVLKGRLAPVYDTAKKEHFAKAFPHAARGKYDVYGLFMERALQLLKKGGQMALLTQDTYLDKEWARELRGMLASTTKLEYIVDLNPFGQLFFNAMNAPCITVTANTQEEADGTCSCLTSYPASDLKELDTQARRERVAGTIREVLTKLGSKNSQSKYLFTSAARIELQRLRETARDRWDLSGGAGARAFPPDWFTAAELLEMRQGVTPGGCLDVFLMDEKKARFLGLENALVHRAIKSKELERWCVQWKERMLFYPYRATTKGSDPAFSIQWEGVEDENLKKRLTGLGMSDALDFNEQIDSRETDIVKRNGINDGSVKELLKHRVALGLIRYPRAAAYLVEHYERLEGRIFEKRKFTHHGKRWYEYHRPRDAAVMLAKPRILSPTLIRSVRFVFDEIGYLSDHACLMIQPTKKTSLAWEEFRKLTEQTVGDRVPKEDLLRYCLAFLNSTYAQGRLTTGHRPTPKGSYAITEGYLKEIPIPPPASKSAFKAIVDLVGKLGGRESPAKGSPDREGLEARLGARIRKALELLG
jgi:Eco57I restriction-modification methylase/N-6 DNA Methylase